MLVLSRHKDESIIIGDYIIVKVIEIKGDKVRLGVEAPKDTNIARKELFYYQKFNEYLNAGRYSECSDILNKGLLDSRLYKLKPEQLFKLKSGLKERGQLNKSIEDVLKKFE